MNRFHASDRSERELATCNKKLQKIFIELSDYVVLTIIEGHRDEERQNKLLLLNKSFVPWPQSKHNFKPSRAVDAAPVFGGEIPWDDYRAFDYFAGTVRGVALSQGVMLRWGGDWNRNGLPGDKSKFHHHDLNHFEIVGTIGEVA